MNLEWVTPLENTQRGKQDLIVIPIKTIIISEDKKFNSIKSAAKWCLNFTGNCNGGREIKVQNKIKKAIKEGTKYCNRYWVQQTVAKEEIC